MGFSLSCSKAVLPKTMANSCHAIVARVLMGMTAVAHMCRLSLQVMLSATVQLLSAPIRTLAGEWTITSHWTEGQGCCEGLTLGTW